MKDFMFVFRGPTPEDLNLSPEESQASMEKWFGWIRQLNEKGRYVAGDPLMKEGKTIQGKKACGHGWSFCRREGAGRWLFYP